MGASRNTRRGIRVAVPRSTKLVEESTVEVAISPRGGGTAPGRKGGAGAIGCTVPRGAGGLLRIICGLGNKGWGWLLG